MKRAPAEIILLAILLLLPLLDGVNPRATVSLGRVHTLLIHFPIGLLLLGAGWWLWGRISTRSDLSAGTLLIWRAGCFGAVAAVAAGYLLTWEGGYGSEAIYWHKTLGLLAAVAAVGTSWLIRVREGGGRGRRWLTALTLTATVGLLIVTAHLGGDLAHGSDHPNLFPGLATESPSGPGIDPADLVIFTDLVQPILSDRCVSCHGSARISGDLKLDSWGSIQRGGGRGRVLIPADADSSEIVRRITASLSDPDRMPPAGRRPLTVGETEVIRWWIEQGASPDQTIGDAAPLPPAVKTVLNRRGFQTAAAPELPVPAVPPAGQEAIERLRAAGLEVALLSRDQPFLQVDARRLGQSFGDQELRLLLDVAEQVTWFNASRTGITDAGLDVLGGCRNLTRLDLSQTAVGDPGLTHLAGLPNLLHLNLYGTRVSDQGLRNLEDSSQLRKLYLWQTGVTDEGVRRLREQRPQLEVNIGARLSPEVPEKR